MATTFVKKASGQSGSASLTLPLTMASAPTAGNLLVFAMAGDKNTGALTLVGFTQLQSLLSASVSLYLAWKVADGTETAITPTWATASATGNVAWYGEFNDPAVTGAAAWQISAQASHITDETNVTSWSTGTTGTTSAAGLGLSVICMDSADSVTDGTTAWTNSFAALFTTLASAGARGGLHLGNAQISSGVTAESTFSYTPSATLRDQLSGALAVFSLVPLPTDSAMAESPTATGSSFGASTALAVSTDAPTATGSSFGASTALAVSTDAPTATGAAFDIAAGPAVLPVAPVATGAAFDAGGTALGVGTDTTGASGASFDTGGIALGTSAAAPGATGSAWDVSSGLLVQPDTVQATGAAYSASVSVAVTVTAAAGAASAVGVAFDVRSSSPQTPIRLRISGKEPSGRTGGYQPVSSWAGREPSSRAEGSEAGS
jgi:hypothetical protein